VKNGAILVVALAAATLPGATGIKLGEAGVSPAGDAGHLEALLDPIDIARQLCGDSNGKDFAGSRAPFLRMARLYAAEMPSAPSEAPPLWAGLGELKLDITTSSDEARAYFVQGMLIANDFNHTEAIRSFRWAQKLDPDCAMCYWGEALALGPNINAPMPAEAAPAAYAAARKAVSLAAGVSGKERALIEAQAKRYGPDGMARRAELDNAYAVAMQKVAKAFPEDDDIQALAAEAMMDAQPWDYWEADYRTPKGRTAEILEVIETVLARNDRGIQRSLPGGGRCGPAQ
jgi:hypothetical protein